MFQDVFRNKTVLLTGHTGFKGTWLSLWLQRLGARVVGYALDPPTMPSLFDAARLTLEVDDVRGDIREVERLRSLIAQHQPAFVFHLAAQAIVRRAYQLPRDTFEINLIGTLALLDAIRSLNN